MYIRNLLDKNGNLTEEQSIIDNRVVFQDYYTAILMREHGKLYIDKNYWISSDIIKMKDNVNKVMYILKNIN
jgi:hypothetical protein